MIANELETVFRILNGRQKYRGNGWIHLLKSKINFTIRRSQALRSRLIAP